MDQGLYTTATCRSSISRIDAKKGKLYYRGLSIEEIVSEKDFLDVACQLIIPGKPGTKAMNQFKDDVLDYFYLDSELKIILDKIPVEIHPMNFLSIGILTLPTIESKVFEEPFIPCGAS